MSWRDSSNEVSVSGNDVFVNNERVGYVSDGEIRVGDDVYWVSGNDIYCNSDRVGYVCGDGDVRMKDGSLWSNDDDDD